VATERRTNIVERRGAVMVGSICDRGATPPEGMSGGREGKVAGRGSETWLTGPRKSGFQCWQNPHRRPRNDSVLSFIDGAPPTNGAELIGAARRRSDKLVDCDSVPSQRSREAAITRPEGAYCSIVLVQ
jgi:hypothetical protein